MGHICPTALEEVAEAAVLNPDNGPFLSPEDRLVDKSWVLDCLTGSVTINDSGLLGIAHFSVVEYLESARILRSSAYVYHMHVQQTHLFLARACLNYFGLIATPESGLVASNKCSPLPLEKYICGLWNSHINRLSFPLKSEITSTLRQDIMRHKPLRFSSNKGIYQKSRRR